MSDTRPFCCAIDVVTRSLPKQKDIKFPAARERLLKLMAEDQTDRSSFSFFSQNPEVVSLYTERDHSRAQELSTIVGRIGAPSVRNIDLDGSRAVWLIALHNVKFKNTGSMILAKMRQLFYRDKSQVFYPGIPFLVDRLMISRHEPLDPDALPYQHYGTQGFAVPAKSGVNIKPFPVRDPNNLAARRRRFNLELNSSCQHRE
jgi:hypothetical protein